MNVYVGMDVHRKRSQVAIVDDAGIQQRNRNLPNDPAKLVPILGTLAPGTPVGFEAAYGWGWLVELLEELELEPHLVHPSRCKAIASARLKNDKVDAATLAQLLRADLLPEAWIAPQATRDLRALLRHRASLVRLSTCLKNRVHAVLADRGIGEDRGLWTGPGRAWLAALELPPTPRAIIEDCCGLLDALATPIGRLEREIAALAKPDPRVQALMALPGVGRLTAMTLVAEIGDISRFPTARKLCAWAGLTPQVRNSDRKIRHGHITKQGSPWVRGILQEAAQTAKRHPMFAPAYGQLARRRGTNIATVAIARRLLARSFHILTQLEAQQKPSEKASTGRARVFA
ncbi:MAG TPA: IS110 family transposase [Actinomycetes bacterium]|jgi:transposase|nr:IS110 family transposase [Actinomycetes bacterium]